MSTWCVVLQCNDLPNYYLPTHSELYFWEYFQKSKKGRFLGLDWVGLGWIELRVGPSDEPCPCPFLDITDSYHRLIVYQFYILFEIRSYSLTFSLGSGYIFFHQQIIEEASTDLDGIAWSDTWTVRVWPVRLVPADQSDFKWKHGITIMV